MRLHPRDLLNQPPITYPGSVINTKKPTTALGAWGAMEEAGVLENTGLSGQEIDANKMEESQ